MICSFQNLLFKVQHIVVQPMETEQPNIIVVASTPKTTVQVIKGFDLPQKEMKFSRPESPGSGRATPISPQQNFDSTEENIIIGKTKDNT